MFLLSKDRKTREVLTDAESSRGRHLKLFPGGHLGHPATVRDAPETATTYTNTCGRSGFFCAYTDTSSCQTCCRTRRVSSQTDTICPQGQCTQRRRRISLEGHARPKKQGRHSPPPVHKPWSSSPGTRVSQMRTGGVCGSSPPES